MKEKPAGWTISFVLAIPLLASQKNILEENIKDTASTASKLAEKIIPVINAAEVVFFCGNLRRSELPEALVQKGIAVKEIIVYKTSLAPVSINKKYDAVIFFSPSAAESFFSRNSVPRNTALFVMGETPLYLSKILHQSDYHRHEPDKNKLISQ
jgi:uroporphyrinogen-III synthase